MGALAVSHSAARAQKWGGGMRELGHHSRGVLSVRWDERREVSERDWDPSAACQGGGAVLADFAQSSAAAS